jgi:dihydroorotate dehydrogenase (fumarate)
VVHSVAALRLCAVGSLAASGGVHNGEDALKLLLAGAHVAMTTSALLRHGPEEITKILDAMQDWMIERGYVGISELRGSVSRSNTPAGEAYERANYYQVVHVPVGFFRR